jgi:tetratricopeptide (TPR) repeat protein
VPEARLDRPPRYLPRHVLQFANRNLTGVGFCTVVRKLVEMRVFYRSIWLVGLALLVGLQLKSQAVFTSSSDSRKPLSSRSAGTAPVLQPVHLNLAAAEITGDSLMASHRYQAALELYQRVETPTAKLWSRMGIAYQNLLDIDDAVRCYRKSLDLDPNNPRVLNDLATAFDQFQDHRRAEELYRKAIRLDPKSAIYWKNLGTNLLAQHYSSEGAEVYEQALALDPHIFDDHGNPSMMLPVADNAETNYARASSCAKAGLKSCAIAYLSKAMNEGSATPKRVAADAQFDAMRNDPALQQLLFRNR